MGQREIRETIRVGGLPQLVNAPVGGVVPGSEGVWQTNL